MSSLVDIWTRELARIREKRASSDAGSPRSHSSPAVGGGGGEEMVRHLVGRRGQSFAAGDKSLAMRDVALSEATIWMLMDRFAPS